MARIEKRTTGAEAQVISLFLYAALKRRSSTVLICGSFL
jgi:hypothetical protein